MEAHHFFDRTTILNSPRCRGEWEIAVQDSPYNEIGEDGEYLISYGDLMHLTNTEAIGLMQPLFRDLVYRVVDQGARYFRKIEDESLLPPFSDDIFKIDTWEEAAKRIRNNEYATDTGESILKSLGKQPYLLRSPRIYQIDHPLMSSFIDHMPLMFGPGGESKEDEKFMKLVIYTAIEFAKAQSLMIDEGYFGQEYFYEPDLKREFGRNMEFRWKPLSHHLGLGRLSSMMQGNIETTTSSIAILLGDSRSSAIDRIRVVDGLTHLVGSNTKYSSVDQFARTSNGVIVQIAESFLNLRNHLEDFKWTSDFLDFWVGDVPNSDLFRREETAIVGCPASRHFASEDKMSHQLYRVLEGKEPPENRGTAVSVYIKMFAERLAHNYQKYCQES